MRNIKGKMKNLASKWLDIPMDVAANMPRISIVGPYRIYVENHQGVEHFSNEEVRMKTSTGSLSITGEQLVIQAIYPEAVWVEGKISGVRYLD
ncbi:sporulation protein YqfC [Kroppenstedtia pulmonis]|uniref:Sporulation protein YqfC n=1 Tax=Kroppenstedtia pulmonis TaxID=1380685 RepID=A0A7D3XRA7_9BACL|nr:sporulation protein YqfC [Kroppenstedtia pulmonis]QKG84942.1 sporulation protein YqfC [Kroppenstedtia pulmonis]